MCACVFVSVCVYGYKCVHVRVLLICACFVGNWSVVHEFFMYCIKVHIVGTAFVIVLSLHLH